MADPNDSFLLREYAERQSESAFSELVRRHVNFVYSVALRHVGNPPDAQDVAQAVFVILARKSTDLCRRTTLTGWLYEATRLTARQLLRTKARRLAREQEAYMQSHLDQSGGEHLWRQLASHLEEAMSRLRAADRELLALRFYENKTGAEAAALLGIRAAAAHKRTNRALEKLQSFFAKRGVDSTATAIAENISTHSVQAAPAALAKTVAAVALAKGATASISTLTLIKGALKNMAWTKAKSIFVTGVCLFLILAGGATLIISHIRSARYDALVAGAYTRGHLSNPKYTAVLANLRSKVWPEERRQAGAVIKSRQQINETVNAVTIDLKPYINAALTDSPASSAAIRDNNLAELPSGIHDFGGVPFDVEGLIQLNGTNMLLVNKTYPAEADGIAINRKCAKIYLLHAADWIYLSDFGKTVARLVLHYENGSERQLDIVAGKNVFDSWGPLFTTGVDPRFFQMAPGTERAWTGSNPFIKSFWPDESLILYKSTFTNPQPDAVVSTLDYDSTMTGTAPFLVGLTVE